MTMRRDFSNLTAAINDYEPLPAYLTGAMSSLGGRVGPEALIGVMLEWMDRFEPFMTVRSPTKEMWQLVKQSDGMGSNQIFTELNRVRMSAQAMAFSSCRGISVTIGPDGSAHQEADAGLHWQMADWKGVCGLKFYQPCLGDLPDAWLMFPCTELLMARIMLRSMQEPLVPDANGLLLSFDQLRSWRPHGLHGMWDTILATTSFDLSSFTSQVSTVHAALNAVAGWPLYTDNVPSLDGHVASTRKVVVSPYGRPTQESLLRSTMVSCVSALYACLRVQGAEEARPIAATAYRSDAREVSRRVYYKMRHRECLRLLHRLREVRNQATGWTPKKRKRRPGKDKEG